MQTNRAPDSDLSLETIDSDIIVLAQPTPVVVKPILFKPSEEMMLQRLIDSKQLPVHIKTIADVYTIGKMGRELGFPVMQALHFIIPIQGKLTLSAKAIGALMRKNGVTMQTLEDALYIYRDGAALEYPRTVVDAVADKPIDRRTVILFTRDGIAEKVSFTWIDATNQGLTTKDNYRRMPK